jgi:tetratricopeptide (TPR) repeat protein
LLVSALERDPENSEALTLLARRHFFGANPDFKKTEELVRLALELNPRNVKAMQLLSGLLSATGRASESLQYIRQAAVLEPYSANTQQVLATRLRVRGEFEGARVATGRMREIAPASPSAFYTEGLIGADEGRIDQAVYWFVQGYDLDPADPELAAMLSNYWLNLDDLQQAEQWLDRAVALDPDHPATLGARIRLLLAREMYAEARQLARQSLQLNLQNRWGYKAALSAALTHPAFEGGDAARALQIEEEIFAEEMSSDIFSDPSVFQFGRLARANLLLKIDPGSNDALETIRREKQYAEQVDRSNNPSYWHQVSAQIAMLDGDHDMAVDHLHEAFELGDLRLDWRNNFLGTYVWADLHQHAGFQQIITMLEVENETQRENAHKLLASLQ